MKLKRECWSTFSGQLKYRASSRHLTFFAPQFRFWQYSFWFHSQFNLLGLWICMRLSESESECDSGEVRLWHFHTQIWCVRACMRVFIDSCIHSLFGFPNGFSIASFTLRLCSIFTFGTIFSLALCVCVYFGIPVVSLLMFALGGICWIWLVSFLFVWNKTHHPCVLYAWRR